MTLLAVRSFCAMTLGVAGILSGCGSAPRAVVSPSTTYTTAKPQGTLLPRQSNPARQILVKFRDGVKTAEVGTFRSRFQTRNVGQIAAINIFIEEVEGTRPLGQVLAEVNTWPSVAYAEANGEVTIEPAIQP